jgi:hypothetical protein
LKPIPSDDDGIYPLLSLTIVPSPQSNVTQLCPIALATLSRLEPLALNGLEFNAFSNLSYALREVVIYWRKNGREIEKELIWVDQICIDQSNPVERSHQVSQMRDIYTAAEIVLISLATKDTKLSSAGGVEWMIQLRQKLREINCEGYKDTSNSSCTDLLYEHMEKSFVGLNFQKGCLEFFQLIKSEWWRRAWIYQEFVVASEANFLYRGVSMSWQDFATVIIHLVLERWGLFQALRENVSKWIQNPTGSFLPLNHCVANPDDPSPDEVDYSNTALNRLSNISTEDDNRLESAFILIQIKYNWKGPTDLKTWLECGRICSTSDRLDKVYAFLGLAREHYNIIPDYSPSDTLEKLFLEVVQKIVSADGTLDLLSYVRQQYANYEYHLPTWPRLVYSLKKGDSRAAPDDSYQVSRTRFVSSIRSD